MKKKTLHHRVRKVMKKLAKLQEDYPDTKITLETKNGSITCEISEAIIYREC